MEEATYQAGARDVYMVEEPIAAAIGAGVDVTKPFGNLVVDIEPELRMLRLSLLRGLWFPLL